MFQPIRFAHSPLAAPNRFLRSATAMFFCDEEGNPLSPTAEEYYGRLAAGGVGTIVMEYTYVEDRGVCGPAQLGLSKNSHIAGHIRLLSAIRKASPRCVVLCQLVHGGDKTPKPSTAVGVNTATHQQIDEIVAAFAAAAVRAFHAGYDGVQIHAAHSFLISSFLSPARNHRTDEYGPVAPGRPSKFLDRVIDETREALAVAGAPDHFILGIKLQTDEFQGSKPGMTPALAAEVAKHIAPRVSLLETSGGAPPEDPDNPKITCRRGKGRFYYRDVMAAFREAGVLEATTVACTGGLLSPADFDEAVAAGAAIVGASRPFLRNINFVRDLEEGREGPWCVSCCQCFTLVPKIGRAGCVFADGKAA